MFKYLTTSAMALPLILSGCASAVDLISDGKPGWAPNLAERQRSVENERRQERLANDIVNGSVKTAIMDFHNHYEPKLPGANLNMRVEPTGKSIDLKMDWSSPRVEYLPGKYNILTSKPEDGRDVAAFSYLTASTINRLDHDLREAGISYEIVASFEGCADAVPMSKNKIYRGDLGSFDLPASSTTVNGQHSAVSLRPGNQLDNIALAALRARSMSNLVHDLTGGIQIRDEFNLLVSNETGSTHRYAQISVHLAPKSSPVTANDKIAGNN